jgi:single-stranded DNA-specific DHH superfamily exonuclease
VKRNEGQPIRRRFDVCNGDADGLCAVLQWRLHEPVEATLVTGLKREIALLQRVPCEAADEVLVCDLSMQRNRAALLQLLAAGARVRYFDHHATGEVPRHVNLDAHLDFGSEVCTSLLVDRHLGGRHRAWALVGAYGDDLVAVADRLAIGSGLDAVQRDGLRRLGQAINYNAYGDVVGDVLITPDRLYAILARWPDPLAMLAREPIVDALDAQQRADLAKRQAIEPAWQDERARVIVLPDAPWSRRVIGCLANELATAQPQQAQAVLRTLHSGDYSVSVRAPRAAPVGASKVCEVFGGSGRAGAAGIDVLAAQDLDRFIHTFSTTRWGATP